jgi:hypothetical protein
VAPVPTKFGAMLIVLEAGPTFNTPLFIPSVGVILAVAFPGIKVSKLLFEILKVGVGTFTVKLFPEVVTLETPVPVMLGADESGTVAVVTTVPLVKVIEFPLEEIEELGMLMVAEFAPLVTVAIPPRAVMVCATCAGTVAVLITVPLVKVSVFPLAEIEELGMLMVAEFAPLVTVAIPPKAVMVCATCAGTVAVLITVPLVKVSVFPLAEIDELGIVMVAEFAPLVTVAIPPKAVMVCATCAGTVAVLITVPLVKVSVFPLAEIDELGIVMVAEFAPLVTVAIPPKAVMVCGVAAGSVTVLTAVPCVIDKTFEVLDNAGAGTFTVKLFAVTLPAVAMPVPVTD